MVSCVTQIIIEYTLQAKKYWTNNFQDQYCDTLNYSASVLKKSFRIFMPQTLQKEINLEEEILKEKCATFSFDTFTFLGIYSIASKASLNSPEILVVNHFILKPWLLQRGISTPRYWMFLICYNTKYLFCFHELLEVRIWVTFAH